MRVCAPFIAGTFFSFIHLFVFVRMVCLPWLLFACVAVMGWQDWARCFTRCLLTVTLSSLSVQDVSRWLLLWRPRGRDIRPTNPANRGRDLDCMVCFRGFMVCNSTGVCLQIVKPRLRIIKSRFRPRSAEFSVGCFVHAACIVAPSDDAVRKCCRDLGQLLIPGRLVIMF